MPANNFTAATAFSLNQALAPSPYDTLVTEDATGSPSLNYALWFSYTPRAGESILGMQAYAESGGNYRPEIELYDADGVTLYHQDILSPSSVQAGHNQPLQVPAFSGETILIRVSADSFSVLPFANLKLFVQAGPQVTAPIGSIFVPDDNGGSFPGAVISDDGTTFQYRVTVNGEEADVLPSGIFAILNDDEPTEADAVVIYSAQMAEIARVALFPNEAGINSIRSDGNHTFYVSHRKTGEAFTTVKTVSDAGVTGPNTWVLPTIATTIAPNRAGTILYYSDGAQGGPTGGASSAIKRWDLVNNVALSDLVAAVATHYVGADLFVMADGNILALYGDDGAEDYFARIMNTAGATIRDIPFALFASPLQAGPRMALGSDDPESFWIWATSSIGSGEFMSRFVHIRTSDGATLITIDRPVAEEGVGVAGAGNDPDIPVFGNSFSCPFLILRQALTPLLQPAPLPSPQIDNSVPCCDTAGGGGSSPGPIPPSISTNWYRRCTGGGVVPTAADVADSEDWANEVPPKAPDSWLTIVGDGEADERWGLKPLSDAERFVAGRLIEAGTIERRSSDKDGHYAPARMRLVAQDDDGTFRGRLGDAARRNVIHREARYELLSYAGRKAGLDPIPRLQGRMVDVQPGLDRTAIVEVQDVVGSQYGTLDPEKTIGLEVGDEHPAKPESSKGRIYNILLGEKSDAGKVDSTGAPASIGTMPVVDCGDSFIDGATPDPEGRLFNDALTVVDDAADVNLSGAGGTITYPTRVFVAPIIGGEIGPFSNVPTGFLDPDGSGSGGPSDAHAHRKVWMDIAGGADDYLAVFTKVPGFQPETNPTVDPHARYKVVSGTPSLPAFPPRNGGVGPQWDFYVDFLDDTDGDQWGVQTISAPLNLNYTITGTPGTTRYVYAVSAFATLGESPRSAVLVVDDGPAVLDGTNNIVLTWDPPQDNADGVIGYRIRGRTTNPPTMYLRTTEADGSPLALTYTDDGTDTEKPFNAGTDSAVVSENLWTWMACGQGDGEVHEVYGSDAAEGDTPKRRLIGWDEGLILGPTSTGWTESERYRVVGGIRQFGFWVRGLPLQHHRSGDVTLAWNGCGPEDADGLLINQVFRELLIFLNEFVEKDDGVGYRDGDFGPIETFSDGTPKFQTTKFEAAQQQTVDWLTPGSPGALGYVGTIVVTEPTPLAEVLRRFFNDYGGHLTTNHRGQVYPYLLNPDPDPGAGRIYRERKEIARLIDHHFARDEQENRIVYSYDYNFDIQSFRAGNITVEDADSITAHGGDRIGVVQTGLKECFFANDEATIEDRWDRHLTLYAYAPRYVQWATNMKALPDNNGDPARFSHRKEGLGLYGDTGTAGQIMHTVESVQPYEVLQTAMLFRSPDDQLTSDDTGELLLSDEGDTLLEDGA